MKVAVVGCIHGELEIIYRQITELEQRNGYKIDLLLICGDFQSIRNENDFKCVAIPAKFRQLGSFHQYYKGEKIAPVLTIFIGGNHEASNYLMTLPYGGWVAENIFFMGYSNIIRYKGLRIGGISGIYNKFHRDCGHFERLPMNEDTKRSVYHTRHLEAYRFMCIKEPLDVFMSHDWPSNIVHYGNLNELLRKKPFFDNDIKTGKLGSPMLDALVNHLRPNRWFSAHLHVRFEAKVQHGPHNETNFLALDKCLPRRRYLEIIDIEPLTGNTNDDDGSDDLQYDKEWLAALRVTDEYLSIEERPQRPTPDLWVIPRLKLEDELENVEKIFQGDYKIKRDFKPCQPVLPDEDIDPQRVKNFINPQTEAFCNKLGIRDPISMIIESSTVKPNPEEISLSDEDEDEAEKATDGQIEKNSNQANTANEAQQSNKNEMRDEDDSHIDAKKIKKDFEEDIPANNLFFIDKTCSQTLIDGK